MAGFYNDIVYAKNVDFSGQPGGVDPSPQMTQAGQLCIGRSTPNAGGTLIDVNTLTPGPGIAIINGDGSITISVSGGGVTWVDVSGAFNAVASTGYFITATATATLPASPSQGDTIKFFVDTTDVLTIQLTNSQILRLANGVTSADGTAVSTQQGDSIELVYRAADTCWCAIAGASGAWSLS